MVVVSRILLGLSLSSAVFAEDVVIHNELFDLTAKQILDEVQAQPKDLQEKFKTNETMLRKFVDGIYNESLFNLEANKQNLASDPVVANKIAIATRKVLVEELLERKKSSIKVPDMESLALAEYEAHPENYAIPESIHAHHILLKFDAQNKAEKTKLLQSLSQQVSKGKSFAELATQFSEDPGSAKRGGDLGFFTKGQMVPAFEQAAFALKKPKQLSDIVETPFGLHLIQLDEYTPPKIKPYAEVKDQVKADLEQEYLKNEIKSWRLSIIDPEKAKLNTVELDNVINAVKKLP